MPLFLLAAIAVSAALHILADARKAYPASYVLKPLTVFLIAALAAARFPLDPFYYSMVLIGLGFSLAGDIALMLRHRRFALGLACFLAAHLFYIAAFLEPPSSSPFLLLLAVLLGAYACIIYRALAPSLGRLKPAVLAYLVVLLCMLLAAANRWRAAPAPDTMLPALGAGLFVVSDSLLAVRQFRRDFPSAQALILSAYYAAQTLIALG